MLHYSFVSIRMAKNRSGALLTRDYREVIREQAAEGWRFVQAIHFETHAEPRLDLVFEREEEQK